MGRQSGRRVFPERQVCNITPLRPAVAAFSCAAPPDANRIIKGLYIGDVQLALKVLQSDGHMGVTHVLSLVSSSILSSLCKSCSVAPTFISSGSDKPALAHFDVAKHGSGLLRMVIPLEDTPEQNILQVLPPCFEFIDEGRRHGAVLVHCMAGASRSASIVAAYLMRTLSLSLKQAMAVLDKDYKKASPNPGFMQQLCFFEKQLLKDHRRQTELEEQRQTKLEDQGYLLLKHGV